MAQNMMNTDMQHCIDECTSCHAICLQTIQHCLSMGGKHVEPEHLRLMQDCVQICQTSADFMLRGSPLHMHTCRACAEVCQQCAEDCERLDGEQMKRCAQACRRCAESCRQMSGAAA
jgi:hypothetical protein